MSVVVPENNIGRQVIEIQGTMSLQLTKFGAFASASPQCCPTSSSVTQSNPYPKNAESQGERNMQY